MRAFVILSVATLGLAGAAYAQDSNDPGTIAVPPAPAIVAAPPTIPAPMTPQAPIPPGLVPATPPADIDTGDSTPTTPGQTPSPVDVSGQGQAGGQTGDQTAGQPATPAPQADIAPIPPNTWLPGTTAKIGVLDKIDGSVSVLSIPVGGQSVVGDLQVSVQACMIRPPDQVPDAAVFLALQNNQNASASPNYRGWLVRSAPGAAVAGDASVTFRVIDCS